MEIGLSAVGESVSVFFPESSFFSHRFVLKELLVCDEEQKPRDIGHATKAGRESRGETEVIRTTVHLKTG